MSSRMADVDELSMDSSRCVWLKPSEKSEMEFNFERASPPRSLERGELQMVQAKPRRFKLSAERRASRALGR